MLKSLLCPVGDTNFRPNGLRHIDIRPSGMCLNIHFLYFQKRVTINAWFDLKLKADIELFKMTVKLAENDVIILKAYVCRRGVLYHPITINISNSLGT